MAKIVFPAGLNTGAVVILSAWNAFPWSRLSLLRALSSMRENNFISLIYENQKAASGGRTGVRLLSPADGRAGKGGDG